MKRRRFVVTPETRQDLIEIWDYVAEESSKRADEVLARLYDSFMELAQSPGMGHYREDLADRRHRFWTVHPYVVAYRWQTTPLQIVVVVHGARHLKAFFEERIESGEGEA
jgi:toxin ParE1/3/4